MATTLYLRNAAPTSSPTSGDQSSALPGVGTLQNVSGSATEASLSTTIGTSAVTINYNTLAQATGQSNYVKRFSSPALAAQTISSGTISISFAASEGNAAANMFMRASVYVWRPSNSSVVGYLLDPISGATEFGTTLAIQTESGTSSAVTCSAGDILVVEVWHVGTQSMATSYAMQFVYDGTGTTSATDYASSVSIPGTLSFATQVTKTHTTDALLKGTVTKTHTTDAILKGQRTATHTTSAYMVSRATKTHSTDSRLFARLTKTHTTDSLLKGQRTVTHTTDAALRATLTKTHTTDARLFARLSKTHTTDAYLAAAVGSVTKTHTTDALLKGQRTVTHTTDARLFARLTRTHTTDAALRASLTKSHTTDAYIVPGPLWNPITISGSWTADSGASGTWTPVTITPPGWTPTGA